jgi:hypothetical protein
MEEPIRKEEILDFEGTRNELAKLIADFEKLNTLLGKELKDNVSALTVVIEKYNVSTKEGQIGVRNAIATAESYREEQKELTKIDKELITLKAKLKDTWKDAAIEVERYKKMLSENNAENKKLIQLEGSAVGSVNRLRAELKELVSEYNKLDAAARERAAPAIKKLEDQLKSADEAIGRHQRNVGNYPKITKIASEGFGNLTNAIGGVTGEIGNAVSSFTTAGGVVGLFTTLIAALATAWKNTKENVELYLASADKLKYGFAGYSQDAEKERKETLKRAKGQISAGIQALTEANAGLEYQGSTEAQKEIYKLQADSAKLMIEEGKLLKDQVYGIKDKFGWTQKYNKLLQEQETINDEKLAKETKWEGLEADLTKQRAIVLSTTASSVEMTKAKNDADKIANQLIKEKTDFINLEIKNLDALSKITGTEELVEEKRNALEKELNSIQKEYYNDKIKINKLDKISAKDAKDVFKARHDQEVIAEKENQKFIDDYLDTDKDAKDKQWDADVKYGKAIYDLQNKNAAEQYKVWEKENEKEAKLTEEHEKLKREILGESLKRVGDALNSLSDLYEANKQRELSAAGSNADARLEIEKKYAKKQQALGIGQALINGAMAITEIWKKWSANPVLAAVFTALSAAETLAQVAIIKSQKFARGGSGVLNGPSHASGGVNVGIGEAEGGEHISITSRNMTSRYGPKMLDAVANSINQGKFFEVWGNVNRSMGTTDPYTKKMFDLMNNTPTVYTDSSGNTVKEYPNGQKYVIKSFKFFTN